jgi:release factor glutamine methyltransferase
LKFNQRLIIQQVTGLSKEQLFLSPKIEEKFEKEIEEKFERLEKWEPLEYIINNAEFYGINFYVNKNTLIPRNDTEIMIDEVLKLKWKFDLIDIWTGSSCIPISIIKNSNNIKKCYVIDISKKALEISKINIKKYWLEDKIEQIQTSILNSFSFPGKRVYNLEKNVIITANLPYIKNNDYENVDEETSKYEPDLALYWWKKTGFELYEELIKQCFKLKETYKINNLIVFIEIGFDQWEYSQNYLNKQNLKFEMYKDNSLINRCIKIFF